MKLDKKRKELVGEVRELALADIDRELAELKDQVFWMNFKNRSGQTVKISELQKAKKMIARLHTIKTEKLRKEGAR